MFFFFFFFFFLYVFILNAILYSMFLSLFIIAQIDKISF